MASLSDIGQLEQVAQICEHVFALDLRVVAQHQIAVGIDDPQLRRAIAFCALCISRHVQGIARCSCGYSLQPGGVSRVYRLPHRQRMGRP